MIQSYSSGILLLGIGYLFGSLPTGYLAGKWLSNIDLREFGSGSTGATNVLRHVGKRAALVVFLIDVAKGMAPVFLAKMLLFTDEWQVLAGVFALGGHIWPVWLKGKGGKAVATGLGLFLGLSWKVGFSSLAIFLIILSITKIVSLASIIAAASLPLFMIISFESNNISLAYVAVSIISMALVLWRHRTNINRIIKGVEPKIGQSN